MTQQPQALNLMVTVDEANLVFAALSNLPYGQVSMLIPKLQQQCQSQLQPSALEPVVLTTPTEVPVTPEALVDVNA